MKTKLLLVLVSALLLSACGPTQKITASWVSPEATANSPYESIFVIVMTQNLASSYTLEDRLAALIASRGQKYVVSSSVFPAGGSVSERFTREQLQKVIGETGCDAVLVLSLLDVKTVESYQPGSAYYPMNYHMYGSYYGYYNYYYPQLRNLKLRKKLPDITVAGNG